MGTGDQGMGTREWGPGIGDRKMETIHHHPIPIHYYSGDRE